MRHPHPAGLLHLVHPRRSPGLQGHREAERARLRGNQQVELRRRRQRRHPRPRPRRHRRTGGHAGDGGQGTHIQVPRRSRRLPDLPRHQGPGGDHPGGEVDRAQLRRHQPRGLLEPQVLLHPGQAEEGDADTRLARRPAGHGGGHPRGDHQRPQIRRKEAEQGEVHHSRLRRREHPDLLRPRGRRASTRRT